MDSTSAPGTTTASFFPVHIDSVDNDILAMDLYIRYGSAEPTLFRAIGIEFTERERRRLIEQRIEFLYIPMAQHGIYREALGRRLEGLFRAPGKSQAERGRLIRAACIRMVEDAMQFPGNAGAVKSVKEVGKILARLMEENERDFSYILEMSEHDYYTTTHMVNVGVGCGLLVRALRPGDQESIAVSVEGGLLHDIGKRGIPAAILNKEGKLSDAEWELMRLHPVVGHEELLQHDSMEAVVLEMTRDHHERLDGTGYPEGLTGDQVGFPARVCAVVDVYDAITAARPYRGPIPPAQALQTIAEGLGTQFDAEIFEAWRRIVERLLQEDPKRILRDGNVERRRSRFRSPLPASHQNGHAVPIIPAATAAELPERLEVQGGVERRVHPRFPCKLAAVATFERQMKESGLPPGQPFTVRVTDISRGGVQIQTSWPLSLNDLLLLEFQAAEEPVRRRIRVVRVRQDAAGQWTAGACFVAQEQAPGRKAA